MNKIFQILIKNHVFFLFILLQLISLRLLMSHNLVFESTFLKKTTEISGFFFTKEKNIKEYFFLKELNDALLQENVKLVKQNSGLNKLIQSHQLLLDDTIMHKTNIIQEYAKATLDIRLLPHINPDDFINDLKEIVNDDPGKSLKIPS